MVMTLYLPLGVAVAKTGPEGRLLPCPTHLVQKTVCSPVQAGVPGLFSSFCNKNRFILWKKRKGDVRPLSSKKVGSLVALFSGAGVLPRGSSGGQGKERGRTCAGEEEGMVEWLKGTTRPSSSPRLHHQSSVTRATVRFLLLVLFFFFFKV